MTIKLDNDDLRTIGQNAELLAALAPFLDGRAASCVVIEQVYCDAVAAAAADPECLVCAGSGIVSLFAAFADDVADPEERSCPVCRPWPQGFAGWREWVRDGNGKRVRVWKVAPYGRGENVNTMREVPQP